MYNLSMRNAYALIGITAVIVLLGAWYAVNRNSTELVDTSEIMTSLSLKSPAFAHEGKIPSKFTCDGEGVSPPLSWSGVPEGARSLVLIVDDPDAPGGTWDHWIVFNMPTSTSGIEEGKEPNGVAGGNSWGRGGYGGPCPPSRTHRYVFRLYALKTTLPLSAGASKQEVLAAMEGYMLAQAELVGNYQKVMQ